MMRDCEGAGVGNPEPGLPFAILTAKGLDRGPAAHGQNLADDLVGGIDQQPARAGHDAHEMMKLPFDRLQIRVNIGVVELDIINDRDLRGVVDHLGALVEEGGVVFVRLDDEGPTVGEPGRTTEIQRHATDQKPRPEPGAIENERQHAAGGGLAMRAGHRDHRAAAQHIVRQPGGPRLIRKSGIEHVFDRGVAAPDDIPHHHTIRGRPQMARLVTVANFDPHGFELFAHGRIDVQVRAGNGMAGGPGQSGDAAHEGSTDAQNMNVQCPALRSEPGPMR